MLPARHQPFNPKSMQAGAVSRRQAAPVRPESGVMRPRKRAASRAEQLRRRAGRVGMAARGGVGVVDERQAAAGTCTRGASS